MIHKAYNTLRAIKLNKKTTIYIVLATILIGVVLRYYAMRRGFNFDFESYKIVGDIVKDGGNVYAETARYNYGPVWFTILGIFRGIAAFFSNPDTVYRVFIVGLLTLTDLAIALILKRKYGLWAFVLFFLNPVSIIITGFHNQFDNLAVLIGLLGLLMLPKSDVKTIEKNHVYAALLIGLSLITKHIFFILPIWLFIRHSTLRVKLFMLLTPLILFGLSFLPFWPVGHEGIIQNVFLYDSFANAPLMYAVLSPGFWAITNPTLLLLAALLVVGFTTRKLPVLEAGLWYLIVLVAFSPAIANQYLAIVMPAVIALGVVFFIPYIILATLLLAGTSFEGLHAPKVINLTPDYILPYITPHGINGHYKLIIFSLFLGAILAAVYRYRRNWFVVLYSKLKSEILFQYKSLTGK